MVRRRKGEAGSAMVESALILMVFVSSMIAILDFGQFLFFHQILTERVRNAVRQGALTWQSGCQADCVKNLVVYDSTTGVRNGLAVPRLTTENVIVTPPDASMDSRLTVAVRNYNFAVFNPWLTLSGTRTMRPIIASAPVEAPNVN